MSVGLFVAFARWLTVKHGKAASTARRRLAGVAVVFRDNGQPVPKHIWKAARKAITATEREREEAGDDIRQRKAVAFTVPELRAIYRACPEDLAGLRDRAAILMQFAIAGRRQEIANLRVGDVAPTDSGLDVYVRWGKTGRREVSVLYGQHLESCPVRAWSAWLEASGLTEGHAFPRIRHGKILGPMHPDSVGALVTRAAARAGLEGRTAHGLRAGLATESRKAGHDAVSIAEQGGWTRNSGEMLGYMRITDRRGEDNALYGIGL
jgi:integrase